MKDNPGNCRLGLHNLNFWKGDGVTNPRNHFQTHGRKRIESCQHEFTKEESYISTEITFSSELTSLVAKGRAVDVPYNDFSKAFILVFHNILKNMLTKQGLDKWK